MRRTVGFSLTAYTLTALMLVAGFLALSVGTANAQSNEGPIRIGVLFPFTGAQAKLGQDSFEGVEAARVELNDAGGLFGREVVFVRGDAVTPEQAVSEAERLITTQNVDVIVGTYASGLAYAASTVAEGTGVIYYETGAVADDITSRGYQYLFRFAPNAGLLGRDSVAAAVEFAARAGIEDNPRNLRIAIVGENSVYGKSVADGAVAEAKRLGLNIVFETYYDATTNDLSSIVLRLRGARPDVLVHTGYINDSILLVRQSADLRFAPPIWVGVGSGYNPQDFIDGVGELGEGILVSGFPGFDIHESYAPGINEWRELHNRVFGREPSSPQSFVVYAATKALFDIMAAAGSTDADAIREAALAMNVPFGGTPIGWGIDFTPTGGHTGQNIATEYFVNQWQNGQLVTVYPDSARQPDVEVILPYPRSQ